MLILELNILYYQYLGYLASIDEIKTKFKFRDDFGFDDWHDWLREIQSWSLIFKKRDSEHKTIGKKRALLKQVISLSEKLANHLQTLLCEKIEIVDMSESAGIFCLEQFNPNHDILACLNCSNKQATLYDLDLVSNKLLKFSEDCKIKLDITPSLGKGCPPKNYKNGCLDLLIKMYEFGTNNKATCNWSEYSGTYSGVFLEFVIKMLPSLRAIGVELNYTRNTIAQAIEDLPKV